MPINVIDLLVTTECGPEAVDDKGYLQEVFLNQGSLDGACGPYSIFMALLALGQVERGEVTAFNTDGRTRVGKLINKLNSDYFSLFKNGTHLHDLERILLDTYGNFIFTEAIDAKNKDVIKFTVEHLRLNHPTIVGVNFSGGGHWMLAVGYEEDKDKELLRLLLLDPSGDKPIVCSWNSIVDLKVTKAGRFPFRWWTNSSNVQFDQAIAIWSR